MLCVILNLRAISKYKPPGACIWRGDLSGGGGGGVSGWGALYRGGVFWGGGFWGGGGGVAFRVWGPYTWRGLFSEFYDI